VSGWILILALVGADGVVTQIESVGPFASYEACNGAGMDARAELPIMRPLGPWRGRYEQVPWQTYAQHRIDWVCVATGEAPRAVSREDLCAELRAITRANRRRFEAGER
jgi:hypothetical protein